MFRANSYKKSLDCCFCIHSDLLVSTVEYPLSRQLGKNGENNGENIILEAIRKDACLLHSALRY